MKKTLALSFAFAIILAFTSFAFTQTDPPKQHSIAVEGVVGRVDTNFNDLPGEISNLIDSDRNGAGFSVTYHVAPIKKSPFIVGGSAGVLFHEKDTAETIIRGDTRIDVQGISLIQKGFAQYEAGVADRNGSFQPGIVALAGVKRGNFGGMTSTPAGNFTVGDGTKYYAGAKAFADFKVKKNLFVRTSFQAAKVFGNSTNGFDVQIGGGLVVKFG